MPFKDRAEVAERLAERLGQWRGKNPLILAIPRGSVSMARILADRLEGELDVVLVRKLRHPFQPEYAIGSIDETGHVYLRGNLKELEISQQYLEQETEEQLNTLERRRAQYTKIRPRIDPKDRITIVVDDGIATGATMMAALHAVRAKAPARLIAATGVASPRTIQQIRELADEVVCLETPETFWAVGEFYEDFPQVSDEEVVNYLGAS